MVDKCFEESAFIICLGFMCLSLYSIFMGLSILDSIPVCNSGLQSESICSYIVFDIKNLRERWHETSFSYLHILPSHRKPI
ncbi:hypothetical protein FKM82_011574 [Ascaphus truei]